jgi:hypothetical protein
MRENYNSGEKIKTPTRYVLSLQKALSCFIQIMLFPLELNAIQFENIPSRPASKGSRARVVPHRIAGKAIPDAVPGICSATWCSSKEPAMTWLDSRWNNAVRHGTRHEFHFNSLKKHIEKNWWQIEPFQFFVVISSVFGPHQHQKSSTGMPTFQMSQVETCSQYMKHNCMQFHIYSHYSNISRRFSKW